MATTCLQVLPARSVGWLWAISGDLGTHVRLYTATQEY